MDVKYDAAAQRLREGESDSGRTGKSLKEVMGDKEYEAYQKMDADVISDEDLFE